MSYTKESGHWYTQAGELVELIPAKKGGMRRVNVRDAQRLNLFPSVTKILQQVDKPGLNAWKMRKAVYAALTLPRLSGESDDNFVDRIMMDAEQEGHDAADRGTLIHAALERAYTGKPFDPQYTLHVKNTKKEIISWIGPNVAKFNPSTEKSFAHRFGYGGKVDWHIRALGGFLVDFKTTEKDLSEIKLYDNHYEQVAAYRTGVGIGKAKCAVVFVHVDGSVKLIEAEEKDLAVGFESFWCLLKRWQVMNYKPEWRQSA